MSGRLLLPRVLLGLVALLAFGAGQAAAAPTAAWTLIATRPHDATAFTEGLVADRGDLLESTGLNGQSAVRRLDARTGAILATTALSPSEFGEGLTVLGGSAIQLTWTQHLLHVYDPTTLALIRTRRYRFDGWGLTTNGRQLIASDGSSTLRWLDPGSLRVVRRVTVRDGARPVVDLNELEYRHGVIWANVWHSDRIALIDPASGRVRAWVDLRSLRRRLSTPGEVLNGIARDPVTGQIAVTGKLWSELFVIRLVDGVPAA